jgi:hypothetical protein
MQPLSFDPQTAREVLGDKQAREIESAARNDADLLQQKQPPRTGETYWDQVQDEMRIVLYREQYTKRVARNRRKAEA